MIIRKYEIGSDDDDLTIDVIKSCPIVKQMCVDDQITRDNVADDYYTIAFDNGYSVFCDSENEIIYFVSAS